MMDQKCHKKVNSLHLRGKIISGTGAGRKYLSMPEFARQFVPLLSSPPFPGTLNLQVDNFTNHMKNIIEEKKRNHGIKIQGFKKNGKQYYPGIALSCKVYTDNENIKALVFFPEMTVHPPEIIELISHIRIRDHIPGKEFLEIEII